MNGKSLGFDLKDFFGKILITRLIMVDIRRCV